MRRTMCALLAVVASASAAAQQPDVRFIACPIYRDVDAGRKSGCWLADDPISGVRYDVGKAPTKPDWNKEILVEGQLSAEPDACGGAVLDPVRVSVLPGACTRHMLPAESFKGRTFVLPQRNVRPLSEPRAQPTPPFPERIFYLVFDWNRDFFVYQLDDYLFDQAVTYIRAAQPRRIVVTGFAATKPILVSGRTIVEDSDVARRRAEAAGEALRRMGIDPKIIDIRSRTGAKPADAPGADGLAEASLRRVEIRIIP